MAFLNSPHNQATLYCRRGCSFVVRLSLILACLVMPQAKAQAPGFKEYAVKAVFLFNFARFVEWPSNSKGGPMVVGILGDDPFGRTLDDVVKGETVQNRSLVVLRFRRVDEIKTCHILFISPSETAKYDEIFSKLQGRSILTVGDTDSFARRGGMIRFVTEDKKIRLRVNVAAAKAVQLTISSKLLRQAEIAQARSSD
jgi:hypothetical protein